VATSHNKSRRYEMYKTQAKKILAFTLAVVMTIPMLVGPTTVNVYASQPPPSTQTEVAPQPPPPPIQTMAVAQTAAAANNPFVIGGRIRDAESTTPSNGPEAIR
jgi:hypothetical protein